MGQLDAWRIRNVVAPRKLENGSKVEIRGKWIVLGFFSTGFPLKFPNIWLLFRLYWFVASHVLEL